MNLVRSFKIATKFDVEQGAKETVLGVSFSSFSTSNVFCFIIEPIPHTRLPLLIALKEINRDHD